MVGQYFNLMAHNMNIKPISNLVIKLASSWYECLIVRAKFFRSTKFWFTMKTKNELGSNENSLKQVEMVEKLSGPLLQPSLLRLPSSVILQKQVADLQSELRNQLLSLYTRNIYETMQQS